MMLRGMGFDNTTSLYVASGKIYNSEKYMVPLRQMFPLLVTKETLALPEELAQFQVSPAPATQKYCFPTLNGYS